MYPKNHYKIFTFLGKKKSILCIFFMALNVQKKYFVGKLVKLKNSGKKIWKIVNIVVQEAVQ